MSENLDLVRSIYADWERGDFSSTEWAHPEIEWVIADGPAPGRWKGLVGMAEGWSNFVDAWESYTVEADQYRELDVKYRELDDERVVVLHHYSGRGRASGLELEQMGSKGANVFHIRDGKVTRLVLYFHENALADLGLDPEAGT
jgi:ketosteroid isomerase-like protein